MEDKLSSYFCDMHVNLYMGCLLLLVYGDVQHKPYVLKHFMYIRVCSSYTDLVNNHSDIPCYFCGELFTLKDELYKHKKQHCPTTYQCSSCEQQFDSVAHCNAHEAEHV